MKIGDDDWADDLTDFHGDNYLHLGVSLFFGT